ncbi:MAG: ammonium transporter [Opitutaceae bacterium]|nr:ammonium transporter [Cytophagales bacterium]
MQKKLSIVPFIVLISVSLIALFFPNLPNPTVMAENLKNINTGDTAWIITAAALVLLMTPGLAYFYGGMVNAKNIVSTMLQSVISMAVISVLWIVIGFSLAFGSSQGGFIGDPTTFFMFKGVLEGAPWSLAPTIPLLLFAFYQLKFAIITPALITGAFAERIRFTSYILFICLFSLFIYAPLAHWTWHPEGFLFKMGVLDFAGGTVVHMSAGWAALASVFYLKGRSNVDHKPANIPFVLLGTGLLWFGWFGFNAGSALGANGLAVSAFATTNTASAAAALAWVFFDSIKGKKPSALGACIGAVVGLVAITPAAGFVTISHSIVIGVIASLVSNIVVDWRAKTTLDDTLDVFPCHGVGGIVGMILTGVFAHQSVNAANTTGNGLFYGETALFIVHMKALLIVSAFAFGGSLVLLKITDLISPLRVSEEEEALGLDISQHGESI